MLVIKHYRQSTCKIMMLWNEDGYGKKIISTISPLIPAYMPEKSLLKTAADLYETGFMHILVVDDGSGQNTAKILMLCLNMFH